MFAADMEWQYFVGSIRHAVSFRKEPYQTGLSEKESVQHCLTNIVVTHLADICRIYFSHSGSLA